MNSCHIFKDLGRLTAILRQTVTTILNGLREEGLINFDRRTVLNSRPDETVGLN